MRYVIIGTSGAGKTTLANQLARQLRIPHIELDSLHWEPNWQVAARTVFRRRVEEATTGTAWVVDGNYSKVRDIVWGRATHIIWLDYGFPLIFGRVLRRTLGRIAHRKVLWNGNRETWRNMLSKDSLLWWVITTYRRRKREFPELLRSQEFSHLTAYRFRSPDETNRWLLETLEH